MDAGVLPVKRLDRAKERLAPRFAVADREKIAAALLDDALDLLERTEFLQWHVVSDDTHVLERAKERGFATVGDAGNGLNEALAGAVRATLEKGATSVTVVPADVPLARPSDLQDLLDTGATSDAVIVPSSRDGGTNALYLSPPDLLSPRFGPASFAAHIAQSEARKLRCAILRLPRLELDIDTPEDAEALVGRADASGRTTELLKELLADSD